MCACVSCLAGLCMRELMLKLMALQRMEKGTAGAAGGKGGAAGGGGEGGEDVTAAGCTANVAIITKSHLICANAGDSRAVLCRKGKAVPLSRDHKPNDAGERERITAAGGFVSQAQNGHFRVNGNLNLSRSLGDLKYKGDAKLAAAKQVITAEPDVMKVARVPEEDEFVVLACDGVWDCMSNQEVSLMCSVWRQCLCDNTHTHIHTHTHVYTRRLLTTCGSG